MLLPFATFTRHPAIRTPLGVHVPLIDSTLASSRYRHRSQLKANPAAAQQHIHTLVQMYTRAEGHARESRHTLLRRAPMDDCGEWGGTHLAVGGSWCMKWPYNVTASEREAAIMVFKARKEDISNFCWTNWVASFHGTLTATYSHTPLRLQQQLGQCCSRQFVENNRSKGASLFLSNNLVDTLLYRCGLFLVSVKWSWCRTRGGTNWRM